MGVYPKKKENKSAGPVKYDSVAVGTKEYEKAYNEGRVGKVDYKTGQMTLDMPEFVMTGKDERVKESMRQTGKKFWRTAGGLALKGADVATDVMQIGNFIPHPAAQAVGKLGNILGAPIDAYQAVNDFKKGDNLSGAINATAAVLPSALGANAFKRNSKYLKNTDVLNKLTKPGKRVKYIEVLNKTRHMNKGQLTTNRALLGTLGAETIYDIKE